MFFYFYFYLFLFLFLFLFFCYRFSFSPFVFLITCATHTEMLSIICCLLMNASRFVNNCQYRSAHMVTYQVPHTSFHSQISEKDPALTLESTRTSTRPCSTLAKLSRLYALTGPGSATWMRFAFKPDFDFVSIDCPSTDLIEELFFQIIFSFIHLPHNLFSHYSFVH